MNIDNFYNILNGEVPGVVQKNQDIFFERISPKHLEGMHSYSTDERLYEFLEFPAFKNIDETSRYIQKLQSRIGSNIFDRTAMYWAVARKSDNKIIGTMGLLNVDISRLSAEWGFGIDPKLTNCGYIFQMLEILKTYVFERLKLHRVFSTTMSTNLPTIAVLEGAGLRLDGKLRDYYRKSGVYYDAVIYSMLEEEYYSLKGLSLKSGSIGSSNNDNSIIEKVVQIINDTLNVDSIGFDSVMSSEPKWDSLNHVAIMVSVSKFYNINISPLDIGESTSVKLIVSLVKEKV